jgi:hypothetical protein
MSTITQQQQKSTLNRFSTICSFSLSLSLSLFLFLCVCYRSVAVLMISMNKGWAEIACVHKWWKYSIHLFLSFEWKKEFSHWNYSQFNYSFIICIQYSFFFFVILQNMRTTFFYQFSRHKKAHSFSILFLGE